jgi:hypothetical protein
LFGRLALDHRYHGQGWGNFLLLDALRVFCRCPIRHTGGSGA